MQSVVDTVIVSDLHLGIKVSQAELLLELLKNLNFKRLILLGDVFEDNNLNRLNREQWQVLSYIRSLTNPKRDKEVIWVRGNHDRKMYKNISPLVGVHFVEQYAWTYNGVRYLAIHGDQFDYYMSKSRRFTEVISKAYSFIRNIDFGNSAITSLIDKIHNSLLRPRSRLAHAAAVYAHEHNATIIFCGHTHEVFSKSFVISGKTITYHNTGCWTKLPATYAVIGKAGVEVRSYPKENGVSRFLRSHSFFREPVQK